MQAHSVRQLPKYHFRHLSQLHASETSADVGKKEDEGGEYEQVLMNNKTVHFNKSSDFRKGNWTAIRTSSNDNRDTHLDSRKLIESELSNIQEFAKSKCT